jgi:ABC-type Mn2+/Zn2+ transport system permease subunit
MIITQNLFFLMIVGGLVGAASGYIGSLMVLKRMSLVGDALSHVALPGMAIAITLGISPILGALTALTVAILGIWYLEDHSDTYPEALVGVFFTASLAFGVLLTKESELLEALFGSLEKMNFQEGIISAAISIGIIVVTYLLSKDLIISIISNELAISSGIKTSRINLIYLLLVGVIVSLGIRFVGTLLMGALVIVPAVSAKNIVNDIKGYMMLSSVFGVASAVFGILIAVTNNLSVGAIVVLVSITIYIVTYILNKAKVRL